MKNSLIYLSKTSFKSATECPTKLYYLKNPEYANQKKTDAFLQALSEGGFQVEELSKLYYKNGIEIKEKNPELANSKTKNEMQKHEVTLFEGTFIHNGLLTRVDILKKEGDTISIIEVKAKSIKPNSENLFITKKGGIRSEWRRYIYDVAFQKYILTELFPEKTIKCSLLLTDKTATCPTDALNQKFKITKENNHCKVNVTNITPEDLSPKLLCECTIDNEVQIALDEKDEEGNSLQQRIFLWKEAYLNNNKIKPKLGSYCAECEFYCNSDEGEQYKSGFKECWKAEGNFKDEEFNKQCVLDIWKYKNKNKLISEGRLRLSQLTKDDFKIKKNEKGGLSDGERQWLQVEKSREGDTSLYIDYEALKDEMDSWCYPLHLIDFETAMIAIPFNKGDHPYQGIAFQFSHHTITQDGIVSHQDEFICIDAGSNPNLQFIRSLNNALSNDNGTIFSYGHHENTYLNILDNELSKYSIAVNERNELKSFIRNISHSKKESPEKWKGSNDMVDMQKLVLKYYFDPTTRGSNSIKDIYPSVIRNSRFLQEKYSQPIYGADEGIRSRNFKDKIWVESVNNKIKDPYSLLPNLFQGDEYKDIDLIFDEESLKSGSAALVAYCRMQFAEMSEVERLDLKRALLQYCELDTLAMVMIIEAWKDFIENSI